MFVDSDERSGMCERLFLAEGVASIFTLHSTRAIPKYPSTQATGFFTTAGVSSTQPRMLPPHRPHVLQHSGVVA